MKVFKPLLIRFSVLALMLVGMNFLYQKYFLEKDIQTHSGVINKVRKALADSCEIIYLGESSNITYRADDIDKRAISDFINDYFPNKKIGNITKEATHAGNYYELLRNIPEKSSVKTVIVTLNLRSFDANWIYSSLETPLQKSMVMLKKYPPLYNRFLLSFKGYDVKTDKEREQQYKREWRKSKLEFPFPVKYTTVTDWDKAMFHDGIKNNDGSKNPELTSLACHYIKTYAFQIDTVKNPRIKDFDKIVQLAKKRNWNLIFNLMAENTEKARDLVGEELVFLMKQNRDILIKRYNQNHVLVVDNLETIPDEQFIDQNWTTEHYAEAGRKTIAKNVALVLQKFYPNDFKQVKYSNDKRQDFINDCEGFTIWGQMQTLSEEKPFAGMKSSKTGQEQDFSITFEYPVKNLPDSLSALDVSFQLYCSESAGNSKVVLEISGKDIEFYLKDKSLSELVHKTNEWEQITCKFKLPANFYQGDLLKVYVYNPDNTILYIDDIRIRFSVIPGDEEIKDS